MFFTFKTQKGQNITSIVNLPLAMPNASSKPLLSVSVWAEKRLRGKRGRQKEKEIRMEGMEGETLNVMKKRSRRTGESGNLHHWSHVATKRAARNLK